MIESNQYQKDPLNSTINPKPRRRWLLFILTLGVVLGSIAFLFLLAESIAQYLEPRGVMDFGHVPHPTLGWLPAPGKYRAGGVDVEFDTTASVNSLNMNDREVELSDLAPSNRILALGDSHTFAVGASTFETWPKRTEALLFQSPKTGVIFNAGVIGYSIGQYVERYRTLRDRLKPNLIVVGFSMATDLYDLIPPERGGFVYAPDAPRKYFALDSDGRLIEKMYAGSLVEPDKAVNHSAYRFSDITNNPSKRIRNFLTNFALYRLLKRSKLAMTISVYWRPGGKSLWPGLDTALKVQLDEDDSYRWKLAESMLSLLVSEARSQGTRVVIVNIPYLAQVYDEVWSSSFGLRPEMYDRNIASRRLADICQRIDAILIDTTEAFVSAVKARKRWLHWPIDHHPTPEGHQLIAEVIAAGIRQHGLLIQDN